MGQLKGATDSRMRGDESAIMTYYNEICNKNESFEETNDEQTLCNDFGPWVWANGIQYFHDYNKRDEIRMNPVPKSISNVSKELIKLKADSHDLESFNGFGPWMRPAGFQEPIMKDLQNHSKKKKKKEPITKRESKSITDVNKSTKQETDQQNEADVTDIVALSSHKTHSTPVDPIELKKRLVDLLIQRTTKGDQQALKLKKVVVKPIQVKKFHIGHDSKRLSLNDSRRNIVGDMNSQCTTGGEGYNHVPQRHSLNTFQPEQHMFENIDRGVKLPPVTQMVPNNGKLNLVHKWSTSASPHIRDIKNKNQIRVERRHSEPSQKRPDDNSFTKVKHNSVLNIIRSENGSKLETGSNTLTRRKLGDLGKNTKTECVKSSGAYKNFRLSLYAIT